VALAGHLLFANAYFLKSFAAGSSALILNAAGKSAVVEYTFPDPVIFLSGFSATVGEYCAAGIEIALLAGFVIASEDRSVRNRVYGVLFGTLFILLFNAIRIFIVLYFFSYSFPLASYILHDVLFRASIVVFLATYYAVWYYWDERSDGAKKAT